MLITSASSSSTLGDLLLLGGGRTSLSSAIAGERRWTSAASMIAPAKASPNDSPNEPAAEFTPAASLTRSSEIGDSV